MGKQRRREEERGGREEGDRREGGRREGRTGGRRNGERIAKEVKGGRNWSLYCTHEGGGGGRDWRRGDLGVSKPQYAGHLYPNIDYS